ncbi:MAG TPA: 7-carboxy-7-deazaguanine synthase QueE [Phycisphaerae bacterium]|nr:7-carboxy-7-deazaguanine synthase QueE [Phycisphaerae bacterium]
MKIAEIFNSIQGEGKFTGTPSIFIRTSGCNLRCTWCDTPYASWTPRGDNMNVDEILAKVQQDDTKHVVITGGEPMIQQELQELAKQLRRLGKFVTVETAGTVWQEVPIDLASISPKLSNSTPTDREGGKYAKQHEELRLQPQVLRKFASSRKIRSIQWKFVVSSPEDLVEIDDVLKLIGKVNPDDVVLMPEGIEDQQLRQRGKWVVQICKERGFRFGPRLQIWLYGNTPGT